MLGYHGFGAEELHGEHDVESPKAIGLRVVQLHHPICNHACKEASLSRGCGSALHNLNLRTEDGDAQQRVEEAGRQARNRVGHSVRPETARKESRRPVGTESRETAEHRAGS